MHRESGFDVVEGTRMSTSMLVFAHVLQELFSLLIMLFIENYRLCIESCLWNVVLYQE